ncbi:hypothetical protein BGZ81_008541 [Podila clonocystis]|nr:hypothetical protein BGZ81_008541 [Podila clonocystis]
MKTFTLILATALALTNAAPATVDRRDPCATLSRLPIGNATYADVSSCYNSIEYNPTLAKATITTMRTLYNDFFVFRDTALTPNLALPFTSAPVDVLAKLNEIENMAYKTDFAFHTDLQALAFSLNDAHVNYRPDCYSAYVFQIAYSFYSSIVDGKQSVRVYNDYSTRGHEDCEVVTINGQDAHTFIQAWADKNTGYSKDAGVRFNNAMSNQEYSPDHRAWSDRIGSFSLRTDLPAGPSLDFQLNCGNNGTVTSSLNWVVVNGPTQGTFSNKATYLNNVCYDHPDVPEPEAMAAAPNTHTNPLEEPSNLFLYKREDRRRQHLERRSKAMAGPIVTTPIVESQPESKPNGKWLRYKREETKAARSRPQRYKRELERHAAPGAAPHASSLDLDDATFVGYGNQTAVYQLKSKPHIGVLVVPTMSVPVSHEVAAIQHMLTLLAKRNVTHMILDFSNNGGGDVSFASELANIFFPTQDKTINAHLFRLRVTPSIAGLAGADLANNRTDTYWEPSVCADKATDKPFTTNFFMDPVVITLNQRSAQFTQEVYFDYNSHVNPQITHPWTNDASKLTILTDGQCGSACGMTADHFTSRHGVKAVAVGGVSGSGLSMFSFAGASVVALKEIVTSYEQLKVAAPLARLPYGGNYRVGVAEAYSGTDTTTLEYNPARYSAAYRLDYTPETARFQDKLWGAVSATAWA